MKISPKETIRKLFSDYGLYLKLYIISYYHNLKDNEYIFNRLKENIEEISNYIKNKLKIKINNILNQYLDNIILIIKDSNDIKFDEIKDKLFNISKEIGLLLSSKKLGFILKSKIKFLIKSLNERKQSNYKKEIIYYDNFINILIKISDIIYKLILNNKNYNIYKKKKGGCKLLGEIKCRCN